MGFEHYEPEVMDRIGDQIAGYQVDTGVLSGLTYWGINTQTELFNVYGVIKVMNLYAEQLVIDGASGTIFLQFNFTSTVPAIGVQAISGLSLTLATLVVGNRIIYLGGAIATLPILTATAGITDFSCVAPQILGTEGGIATIGSVTTTVDGMLTSASLGIGTTNTAVASTAFTFYVAGTEYARGAVAAGTAPGNDVIPINLYGAVALDIGTDNVIDVIEAANNAVGYASALLAIAGIPAVGAGHVRMGTITAMRTVGAFTFGTTALDDADSTVAYTDATLLTAASAGSHQWSIFYEPMSDGAYVTNVL